MSAQDSPRCPLFQTPSFFMMGTFKHTPFRQMCNEMWPSVIFSLFGVLTLEPFLSGTNVKPESVGPQTSVGSLNFISSPFADSPRADTTAISTFCYLMWFLQSSPFRLSNCWNGWWHGLTVEVYGKQVGRYDKLLVPDTCLSGEERPRRMN